MSTEDVKAIRRRWFAFSLRTMFVGVTLLCCWLGYCLNWIRQRHDAIEMTDSVTLAGGFRETETPAMLRIFGEEAVFEIYATAPEGQVDAFEKYLRILFPEAKNVYVVEFGDTG